MIPPVEEGHLSDTLGATPHENKANNKSADRGLPLPFGRGVRETKSKNGRSRPGKPFVSRVFCAQRGIQTMVSEGARPWGRGRSEFANNKRDPPLRYYLERKQKGGFVKGRFRRMCPRSGFGCRRSVFWYPRSGFLGSAVFEPSFRLWWSREYPLKPPFWKPPFCELPENYCTIWGGGYAHWVCDIVNHLQGSFRPFGPKSEKMSRKGSRALSAGGPGGGGPKSRKRG